MFKFIILLILIGLLIATACFRIAVWSNAEKNKRLRRQTVFFNLLVFVVYSIFFAMPFFVPQRHTSSDLDLPDFGIIYWIFYWITLFFAQLFTLWIIAEIGLRGDKKNRSQDKIANPASND